MVHPADGDLGLSYVDGALPQAREDQPGAGLVRVNQVERIRRRKCFRVRMEHRRSSLPGKLLQTGDLLRRKGCYSRRDSRCHNASLTCWNARDLLRSEYCYSQQLLWAKDLLRPECCY
ncbi:hypothetical protein Nepgr_023243 [Nepenthes gracilis]|uniref:Uncharacterized protein n=1 Tax=Nepenthes gracilis TaxID=150966 RepID=A0AAD3T2G6_NEPGR|nr:hypothetical protein Nepgr_023243 [Nepenthes gracilis]